MGSSVWSLTPTVNDLFFGRSVRYVVSLSLDATNLVVDKKLIAPSWMLSYPWSTKETSLPPALVPLTVLNCAEFDVLSPGAMAVICGVIPEYWKLREDSPKSPPPWNSLLKLKRESPEFLFADLEIWI